MNQPMTPSTAVRQVLRQVLDLEDSVPLEDDTLLQEDLGIDSMKITQLGLELEVSLGRVVLLNEWLQRTPSSEHRSIGSLISFLEAS